MHPAFFLVYGLAVFVFFLVGLLRMCAQVRRDLDLSAPARASIPARSDPVRLPPAAGLPPGRTASAQERAARSALHPRGARVDVAPIRCPFDWAGE